MNDRNQAAERSPEYLILFDSLCHMCSRLVQFVLKRDKQEKFYFAPLQSEIGQTILKAYGLPPHDWDSFVYLRKGKCLLKSTAALYVLKDLGGVWQLFYPFSLVPKVILDPVYDWVARNRYAWFGQRQSCLLPDKRMRQRFLE
ncbi:thiol-disulfide oxidoreductase DCC [Caldalkalibacillus thermarum TA2.A1]|uniref:Thiol-disulfide oxidoreductase DCC n=1 Tax=Caldalkalibacillus thermarum (strain TA2.A1) TaxID=986075 RepID=F5L5J1_CALTT|nr:DCC1-like thiol-disulfide oxidoreductase family protein [Caldalkalibacillus thermarum]EGL83389.1 thiol-disulfide oxidoreductase DCC [Caldalkalibacillus thermarum TA2.A1]GGK35053.1 hypothetical protein GCM10010965_30010 [Caldalkalibacillus thermarum]